MHKNSLFLTLTGLERAKIVFSDTSQQFSHCDLSEGNEWCLEGWVIRMVMSKKGPEMSLKAYLVQVRQVDMVKWNEDTLEYRLD